MRNRYRTRRRNQRVSCFGLLIRFIVLLVLLVVLYGWLVRPWISDFAGQQVARHLVGNDTAADEAEAVLPGVVAALPKGEVVITEADANAYLAANPGAADPIDQLELRFLPGVIQADIQAFGMRDQLQAGLAVVDGRLTLINPQLEGALGLMISIGDILGPIEQRLNEELVVQNQRVSDARVEQGQIVLVIE